MYVCFIYQMFIAAGLEAIRFGLLCVSKVSGKATVIAAIGVRYMSKYVFAVGDIHKAFHEFLMEG